MGTYWDDFIKRYNNTIPYKPLDVILEAFWNYCKGNKESSDKLMGYRL
jgi:hypothetical protein